jgi:hypothetical protein
MPDRAGASRRRARGVERRHQGTRRNETEKTYENHAISEDEELQAMTVPEENRPKTDTTDEVVEQHEATRRQEQQAAEGRTMREALEDADVRPEDFEDER